MAALNRQDLREKLVASFDAAVGPGSGVPELEEDDPSFKDDISRLDLTNAQQAMRIRQQTGLDGNSVADQERRKEAEERKRTLEDMAQLSRDQLMADIDRQIDALNQQLADIDKRQKELLRDNAQINQELIHTREKCEEIKQRRIELAGQIKEKENIAIAADKDADTARDAYKKKFYETYPNGTPALGMPDPIGEREGKMKNDAWDKNRDTIKAAYEAKGMGKEFAIMERLHKGETVGIEEQQKMEASLKKVGLSSNPDVALIRALPPGHPLRDTLVGTEMVQADKTEKAITSREEFRHFMTNGAEAGIKKLDHDLNVLETKIKRLEDRQNENQQEWEKLEKDKQDITDKIQKLEQYKKDINDPKNAGMTTEEYRKMMPDFARDKYEKLAALYLKNEDPVKSFAETNFPTLSAATDTTPPPAEARTAKSASIMIDSGGIKAASPAQEFNLKAYGIDLPGVVDAAQQVKKDPLVKLDTTPGM